ncbi:unnamed protein product [[Actinomadura] parvosata subsp. kistnae]|uniref:DUF2470 domain-containing protein n=2 Tax=Nonomuraea TaxID=83681 RepID=A0A1V0A9Z5_9ACTN|nr:MULTISPECIES: DUF2470 domain-containing protein [unclassified Nonomuraea]AQZ67050.1 hypothetical protein BKM31_41375 [Nonomuraea sp. ATCC 55076]NJP91972.1 DUF2470 domain-containing protein [Nonomuraea sp. FMUSA5-5]SPL94765.1 unnamed protein product [Actinomadura parvosata subsp. kistnae]
MSGAPFTADVVEAIKRHMNDDHADDGLTIVRALGGRPDAQTALTSDVDAEAITFTIDGGERVRVPWGETLTERAQVRKAVVRLYREACAKLGLPARGEH